MDKLRNNIDYLQWIDDKHKEYCSQNDIDYKRVTAQCKDYHNRFALWLKETHPKVRFAKVRGVKLGSDTEWK